MKVALVDGGTYRYGTELSEFRVVQVAGVDQLLSERRFNRIDTFEEILSQLDEPFELFTDSVANVARLVGRIDGGIGNELFLEDALWRDARNG